MSLNIPMVMMMVLTFIVWVWLYVRRLSWMHKNKISPQNFALRRDTANIPPHIQSTADNFQNLFELPVLFYFIMFYLAWGNEAGLIDVYLAYAFVAFRAVHSLIQCTYNKVTHRFAAYMLGAICLWALLTRIVFGLLFYGY